MAQESRSISRKKENETEKRNIDLKNNIIFLYTHA